MQVSLFYNELHYVEKAGAGESQGPDAVPLVRDFFIFIFPAVKLELHVSTLAVSLENVLLDVKELNRGMELTRREYSMHGHNTMLKEFVAHTEGKLKKLQEDAKIAQVGTAPPGCGPGEIAKRRPDESQRPSVVPAGRVRGGGQVLRGELQNHAAVRLLPRVCAIRQSLQGECDFRAMK